MNLRVIIELSMLITEIVLVTCKTGRQGSIVPAKDANPGLVSRVLKVHTAMQCTHSKARGWTERLPDQPLFCLGFYEIILDC